jgi:hypothetical protein
MHIETFTNKHNGVTYQGVKIPVPIEATVCGDSKSKVVFKGQLTLEKMTGSWKFGNQLQIVIRGKPVRVQKRNPSDYERIEIALPLDWGLRLITMFLNNEE